MEKNDFIGMLLGAGAGYLVGSSRTATGIPPPTECLSIPLTTPVVIPDVTQEDYQLVLDWGLGTKNNFWCPHVFTDGIDAFAFVSSYMIKENTHRIILKDLTRNIMLTHDGTNPSLTYNGTNAIVSSSVGTITYNMVDKTAIYNIVTPAYTLTMTQQGSPFKYNDGNYIVLLPGSRYGQGFEIIGGSTGTLNGAPIQGLGVLERANWNFSQLDIPGYRYIVFNSTRCQGIAVRVGVYHDTGVWLDGVYIKPLHSEINSLAYDTEGINSIGILYLLDESSLLYITLTKIGSTGVNEIQFSVQFTLNRVNIGTGYAWMETSRV